MCVAAASCKCCCIYIDVLLYGASDCRWIEFLRDTSASLRSLKGSPLCGWSSSSGHCLNFVLELLLLQRGSTLSRGGGYWGRSMYDVRLPGCGHCHLHLVIVNEKKGWFVTKCCPGYRLSQGRSRHFSKNHTHDAKTAETARLLEWSC